MEWRGRNDYLVLPTSDRPERPEMNFILFADGSCPKPHGPGGWAYILRNVETGEEARASGGEAKTTNIRMEMQGVIEGLGTTPPGSVVRIVSDSQYVTKGTVLWMPKWRAKGWKVNKSNLDQWRRVSDLVTERAVTTEWVRGHTGHAENEDCDRRAGGESRRYRNG